MEVKIDTREKFHVITIQEASLAANMTEEMDKVLIPLLAGSVKNALIDLKDTKTLDSAAATHLAALQRRFYEQGASFVLWGLQPTVKKTFFDLGLLEQLSFAPTETEAIDIIQLEEIERELGDI